MRKSLTGKNFYPSTLSTLVCTKGSEEGCISQCETREGAARGAGEFEAKKGRQGRGARWAAVNDTGHVIGADHHSAKLSDEDIDMILELRADGLSYARIAAKFDDEPRVSTSMVRYICNGGRRAQTVMGHKRVGPRPYRPTVASLDDFDLCTQ